MPVLISLSFQGEPTLSAPLPADVLAEVRTEVFPRSPPRPTAIGRGYRACKLHPLHDGRTLVSVVADWGDTDRVGRPALRAHAVLLEPQELRGASRDVGALWRVLARGLPEPAALAREVEARSPLTEQEAFVAMRGTMRRHGARVAALAGALGEGGLDLVLPPVDGGAILEAALALLPSRRLRTVQLCTGAVPGEPRERVLVLGEAPARHPEEGMGRLRSLLAGRAAGPRLLDLRSEPPAPDPAALAYVLALTEPESWPGVSDHERLQVLVDLLDAEDASSLFDLLPELDRLRRALSRVAAAERALRAWR